MPVFFRSFPFLLVMFVIAVACRADGGEPDPDDPKAAEAEAPPLNPRAPKAPEEPTKDAEPIPPPQSPSKLEYAWTDAGATDPTNSLSARIPPPESYQRQAVLTDSFAHWLRGLPLFEGRPQVKLYDGGSKGNQRAHHAVVDIDVGKRDLQQCADAVMRLRAEYLWSAGRADDVHFNFTSGDKASWSAWRKGVRPVIQGNKVSWATKAKADSSHAGFRRYLDKVFTYAGSSSLSRELKNVADEPIEIGDIFIQGGFPGHAMLVVDVAVKASTGARVFLLTQSYMPAQQIHVVVNPNDADLSPWYQAPIPAQLRTPEWSFNAADRKRFAEE